MTIEINDQIKDISLEDVEKVAKAKFGASFDIRKELTFKLHPQFVNVDPDDNNRILVPKRYGILPYCSTIIDGKVQRIRYYEIATTQTIGGKDTKVYTPQSVYFVDGGLELDLSGTKTTPNYALAYLLFSHPKLMKDSDINSAGDFYLYRPDEEAQRVLDQEEARMSADSMVLYKTGRSYIKDDALDGALRRMGVSIGAESTSKEKRAQLLTIARQDPAAFVKAMESEGGHQLQIVQEALDMKVLYFDAQAHSFHYTYRDDDANWRKKRINSTPIYTLKAFDRNNPNKGFVGWLANEDPDGVIGEIENQTAIEKEYLDKHPDKPKAKNAVTKMISNIIVE